jgi:hypothetical protein
MDNIVYHTSVSFFFSVDSLQVFFDVLLVDYLFTSKSWGITLSRLRLLSYFNSLKRFFSFLDGSSKGRLALVTLFPNRGSCVLRSEGRDLRLCLTNTLALSIKRTNLFL